MNEEDLKLKTKVVHSVSKSAWNVIGTVLGGKHKVARVPYYNTGSNDEITDRNQAEAFRHATFISDCFNNSEKNL